MFSCKPWRVKKTIKKSTLVYISYFVFLASRHWLYEYNMTSTLAHSYCLSLCKDASEVWSISGPLSLCQNAAKFWFVSGRQVFLKFSISPQICSRLWSKYPNGIDRTRTRTCTSVVSRRVRQPRWIVCAT